MFRHTGNVRTGGDVLRRQEKNVRLILRRKTRRMDDGAPHLDHFESRKKLAIMSGQEENQP